MLVEVKIEGFKAFDQAFISLSPLTILTGLNSSGKSTVIDAIRMCEEGGPPLGRGGFDELAAASAKLDKIAVQIFASSTRGEEMYGITLDKMGVPSFAQTLPYPCSLITADRLGPSTTLPIRSNRKDVGMIVGERGEYTAELLEKNDQLSGVPEKLRLPEVADYPGFLGNVNAWLSQVSPGFKVLSHSLEKADAGRLTFTQRRPANVGFGLSYSLPIFVLGCYYAIRVAKSWDPFAVMLVENPEAHLHPRGQTLMGQFMARVASCGVQCIVETHSDHFFNGVRLAVKDGILDPKQAQTYFFEYDLDTEKSRFTSITIDKYGMCSEWPEGFFDENEINLMKLV